MSEMNKEKVDVNVEVTEKEVIVPAEEPYFVEMESSNDGPKGSGIVAGVLVGAGLLTGIVAGVTALRKKLKAKDKAEEPEESKEEDKPKMKKKILFNRQEYVKIPKELYDGLMTREEVEELIDEKMTEE